MRLTTKMHFRVVRLMSEVPLEYPKMLRIGLRLADKIKKASRK